MKTSELGILVASNVYFHTPSETARAMFFYPLCTGHYICNGNYNVKRASYNSFLLLYVISGKGYAQIDSGRVLLTNGSLLLMDCYRPHTYGTDHGWEILWVHFDGAYARTYYNTIKTSGKCSILPPDPYYAQRCLQRIFEMYHAHKSPNEALINKHIIGILTEFLVTDSNTDSPQSSTFDELLAYIAENICQPLTLDDLAKRVALSPFYFTRLFKKETGYTPHEYLITARVNAAKFYLKTTNFPVKEITFRCGFSAECSFCTTFKRIVGTTPLRYRNELV